MGAEATRPAAAPSILAALRGGSDTIAAIATAPGRGALAIVRMSGEAADAIASRLIAEWPTPARVASLVAVRDPATGGTLDRALVTRFEAGRSFTGEPMVEISTHGGPVTSALVLGALISAGARQAEAGEFTRRAVANGTLTLTQGEAIGDVIDATSRAAQRVALDTLDGGLARRVLALRDALLEVEALIAYDIDFPEEDDGPIAPERITAAAARVAEMLDALLATAPMGELVREGAVVVLAGPPNAGKSSLFNALLGQARALVTPIPGTTRDAIEAVVDGRSWPIRLVDTAGLRDTMDPLERLGIEVSERWLARAQLVLACAERYDEVAETRRRIAAVSGAPIVEVLTKSDVAGQGDATLPAGAAAIAVSAETGQGLAALLERIDADIGGALGTPAFDAPVVTRARHLAALRMARSELRDFAAAWAARDLPAPVIAVHLRAAVTALEELIGVVETDDVLDRVFRSFCVGK
ncbi:MAG TPA: tRNA uridine-5-carboxymethylaminomethyl(34) synthesis GTPase MnmE [Gemmatimonadaceae bacterium]|nr:tRNA uridine-5-carboxymethylaminomethyl(34) synthesis GTPase MnmE [Gemmatimonadaceae bacterium]